MYEHNAGNSHILDGISVLSDRGSSYLEVGVLVDIESLPWFSCDPYSVFCDAFSLCLLSKKHRAGQHWDIYDVLSGLTTFTC